MKNFTQYKILGSNGLILLLVLFFLVQIRETQAQYISNNGTYISISSGTVIGMDSISNYNSATLVNKGTLTIITVNNTATIENNETLATAAINNSGTFQNTEMVATTKVNNTESFGNTGTLTASDSVINSGTFETSETFSAPTVTNSGTFTNSKFFTATDVKNTLTFRNTGTLTASNTVTNSGTFTNEGSFTAADVDNTKSFDNTGTLTANISVTNSGNFDTSKTFSAPTVDNSGTFRNGGSFTATDVNNTLNFGNTGTLTASNSITNSGTFETSETFSAPIVSNSGTFANSGSFAATDLENTVTFVNTGTLTADTVDNSGTFTNDGSFTADDLENTVTFDNTGTLTASISVINSGTFDTSETFSTPNVDNSGTFTNGGSFTATDVNNTLTFGNTGTLTATTVTNSGTFANDGSFTAIETNNTATLENAGTLYVTAMNNEGNILGDGTYTILGDLISSGTFFSAAGAVYMSGTSAQIMTVAAATFNNLTIDNTASVTLVSTQTVITNTLTINANKVFKIEADKNLTVTGTIDNYGGTSGFILKSNSSGTASLLHDTTDVPVTVQRYISGVAEDWHFLSAPVSNQSISGSWNPAGTYGNGTGYDLYIFNEPTPCWTYQLNTTVAPTWPSIHPTANFVTARGYLYSTQAPNPTKEFVGLLNNGAISYPITNESPDLVVQGFNLIGNPYPSSIDWKSINGWSRTNLIPSGGGYDMWIWNQAANNYGVYNSIGGIGTNGVTQHIAPAQGYFIRALSAGDISLSNAVRVHTGASNWLKGTKNETNNLKIRITSNAGHGSDEVLLLFGYPENEAGALKLFSQNEAAPSAYLYDLKKDLSVRYLTDTIENSQVPLHFKAGKDGSYSLSIDSEFGAFDVLLLEDKKNDSITDLNVNANYQFKGTINDDANRFVLHFKDIPMVNESLPVSIFYDGNEVNVDLTLINEETNIKVFDMLGRLLLNKKREGKMIHRFSIHPKHAVYIIVATSKEKSSRKVVLVY
jgi:hypothetical protein